MMCLFIIATSNLCIKPTPNFSISFAEHEIKSRAQNLAASLRWYRKSWYSEIFHAACVNLVWYLIGLMDRTHWFVKQESQAWYNIWTAFYHLSLRMHSFCESFMPAEGLGIIRYKVNARPHNPQGDKVNPFQILVRCGSFMTFMMHAI